MQHLALHKLCCMTFNSEAAIRKKHFVQFSLIAAFTNLPSEPPLGHFCSLIIDLFGFKWSALSPN